MESANHRLRDLFAQLGLPSGQTEIEQWVASHRPLPAAIRLVDADFWSVAQTQFLCEAVEADADWTEVVEELDALLRA